MSRISETIRPGLLSAADARKILGNPSAARDALLISLVVIAGSYSIFPTWLFMFGMWGRDPLRSIGVAFPVIALAGILAAWRRLSWSLNGSFWGLPILALSILLARATTTFILIFHFHQQNQTLLHPALVMFLYGVGAVLLFGGPSLLRSSIAPLCLLLLINPVPEIFTAIVDLPLQSLSASTARHFAHLIGLQPSGEQLRMMFTPTFGMMIAPGCNGIRGSITLGYLALIFGYMRHLHVRTWTLITVASVILGYVLNLLRLCMLVVYYRIGLSLPSIQRFGVSVDYAIGCSLFMVAALWVGFQIRYVEPKRHKAASTVAIKSKSSNGLRFGNNRFTRVVLFAVLILIFTVPTIGAGDSIRVTFPSEQTVLESFPSQVGSYRRLRTYSERDSDGSTRYALADYEISPDGTNSTRILTLGLYVGPGMHLVAYSRFARGIQPDWVGSFDAVDASMERPLSVHFAATLYDDGMSRQYNAESACYEAGCSSSINWRARKFFISTPNLSELLRTSNGIRLTILLRREAPDGDGTPTATQLMQFETDARQFTQYLKLRALLSKDGIPI